ncbi:helix-turn-helix transcriptional regulator [Clostridium sp. D2Q-14]|uniref:helix-turn-helix domain-containing protein n=1 Tax=Anaeromonas gelatinilytica TaxID=2683194 RepID=UPI00193BF9D6|nr:helix-turn-helix transcriptional regulator [Anaeromonas gelatinilytica]MBS4534475.1 helix-turn-helix transcriptional regulator [Anaeromonas gelatinilytica]
MGKGYGNLYKKARKNTNLTQEKASEFLGVSRDSLSAYERGITPVPDDVVCKMIQFYETEWLAYEHLRQSTTVGRKYLPEIHHSDIAESVLKLQKEIDDLNAIKRDMFSIACDGLIDNHELEKWNEVTKETNEVAGAALSLIFTQNKKTSLDGRLEEVNL